MKLRFLGTSAGLPLPRINCRDEKNCLSDSPKDYRLRSSLLLNGEILVDSGPDVYEQLHRLGMPEVKGIVYTHGHLDHILGVFNFLDRFGNKVPLYGSKTTLDRIKRLFSPKNPAKPYQSGKKLEFGDLKITPVPVEHGRTETYALLIEGRKRCLYAPDFNGIPEESWKYFQKADVLILDGSSQEYAPGHSNIDTIIEMTKALGKETYFTHIGIKTQPHEALESYVKSRGGDNYHIAFDNLELEI